MLSLLFLCFIVQASALGGSEFVDWTPGEKDYGCEMALYEDGVFKCAAVLLRANWGVTAAHCITKSASSYTIEAGNGKEIRTLSVATRHPRFVDKKLFNYANDIAFIAWEKAIEESVGEVNVRLIHINRYINENCHITGYGENRNEHVKVDVHENEECLDEIDLHKKQRCVTIAKSGEGNVQNKSNCKGAWGSPLLCQNNKGKWKLGGVATVGTPLCKDPTPSVFTAVSRYFHWLKRQSKKIGDELVYEDEE